MDPILILSFTFYASPEWTELVMTQIGMNHKICVIYLDIECRSLLNIITIKPKYGYQDRLKTRRIIFFYFDSVYD